MIRIELRVDLHYEVDAQGADFIFNVHAAHTASQTVRSEHLQLSQGVPSTMRVDPVSGNRVLRLRAGPGTLALSCVASVELAHHRTDPARLAEVAVQHLPPQVIGYRYPSRYRQSDRLVQFAIREFGGLWQGHRRVMAIQDRVHRHVNFVCRDFAHLMIALCRAVNIPARFATGTDFGADPVLGPPDFHAYIEACLGDRWYIFDPSGTAIPMGFVRFGTGRDAADTAFATIFGNVRSQPPQIRAIALDDPAHGFELPQHCGDAISTSEVLPAAA
jgi:hypothetical protein